MRLPIIAAAVAALIAASAASAHACSLVSLHGGKPAARPVLPKTMFAKNHTGTRAGASIVGFWRVENDGPDGNPLYDSLQQWHSDNTEFEFADIPTIPGDICMGTWTNVGRTYQLWHTAWTFDADGNPAGTMLLTGSRKLSRDGNSFSGPFDLKFFDLEGTQVGEVTGTAHGERLSVPD